MLELCNYDTVFGNSLQTFRINRRKFPRLGITSKNQQQLLLLLGDGDEEVEEVKD